MSTTLVCIAHCNILVIEHTILVSLREWAQRRPPESSGLMVVTVDRVYVGSVDMQVCKGTRGAGKNAMHRRLF